jgi:putative membrane protein
MAKTAQLFSDADRAKINQAVVQAEQRTSAEIVPVVARSSGRYDRPEDIVGLWFALGFLALFWFAVPQATTEPGDWGGISSAARLGILMLAVVGGFVAGAFTAMQVDWLRRLFTPQSQMRDEVIARSRQVFFDGRVHHTTGDSGLMIYISLFERMAAVVGDRMIVEKLGQAALDELCAQLTARLAAGHRAEALAETIATAGDRLIAVLPRSTDDRNELPDALVVID